MGTLYIVLLTLGILITHHFLARRNNPVWGVIIPVLYLAALLWLYIVKKVDVEIYHIIAFLLFVISWGEGRKHIKSKRQKELEKITIRDL